MACVLRPHFVRWESAQLIRKVNPISLPDEFERHYVISVTGLPPNILLLSTTPGLLPSATLALPKRSRLPAEFVALTDDKRTLLFAFPASVKPIQIHDKAIAFEMQFNGIILKTPFEPKKMTVHGSLAM